MQLSEAAAFTIFGGVAVILSLNARKSSGGAIGSIRERTRAVTAAAAASGAIKKLTTTGRVMVDGPTGLQFFVSKKSAAAEAGRQASGAVAKQNKPAQRVDPFASPEEALVVERALTTSHYLQLNKFPIVDDHLLIVTRDFEYQTDVATRADFDALRATLRAVDGFVFYNCGARSGASQPHKHFQMLPRDTLKQLEAEAVGGAQMSHEIPIEKLLDEHMPAGSTPPLELRQLPPPLSEMAHAVVRLPEGWVERESASEVDQVLACYEAMLRSCELPISRDGVDHCADQDHPSHNMVMTRSWMLVAARACDPAPATGLGSNACGFGGFFLVKDDVQLAKLERHGPSQALIDVTVPRAP